MKIKLITWASDKANPGWLKFEESLKAHNWEYFCESGPWMGYGSKLLGTYEYLKAHKYEMDLVMISDSFDSLMMCSPEEVLEKYTARFDGQILSYAERACWQYPEWADRYPKVPDTPYQYLNGGGFICTPQQYIDYIEMDLPVCNNNFNDQVHTSNLFLTRNEELGIVLDNYCEIFQCCGHAGPDDFSFVDGRIVNNITHTTPCILHFNGHSFNDPIWDELLGKPLK
jgi:hypothetical protein